MDIYIYIYLFIYLPGLQLGCMHIHISVSLGAHLLKFNLSLLLKGLVKLWWRWFYRLSVLQSRLVFSPQPNTHIHLHIPTNRNQIFVSLIDSWLTKNKQQTQRLSLSPCRRWLGSVTGPCGSTSSMVMASMKSQTRVSNSSGEVAASLDKICIAKPLPWGIWWRTRMCEIVK